MVLSNSAKRARYANTISNQNQGGGSKKAGFPYIVGRDHWSSLFLGNTNVVNGKCCGLKSYQQVRFPLASLSHGVGRQVNLSYWKVKGT
jgi:hypothetical protein